jgi:hypothetical protein
MRHPGHPLGPVGHLALVTGLASAEADTRVAAAQLWTEASADGRLNPELAADAIVAGVTGNALMLSRIAEALDMRRIRRWQPVASWKLSAPASRACPPG